MGKKLITGGLGFTGAYLARQLLQEGEDIVLFQRRKEIPPSAEDLNGKVTVFSGDISNWVHVVEAVKSHGIDGIYHSAALLTQGCDESAAAGFRVVKEYELPGTDDLHGYVIHTLRPERFGGESDGDTIHLMTTRHIFGADKKKIRHAELWHAYFRLPSR